MRCKFIVKERNKTRLFSFYVLLTVHPGMIIVNNQIGKGM